MFEKFLALFRKKPQRKAVKMPPPKPATRHVARPNEESESTDTDDFVTAYLAHAAIDNILGDDDRQPAPAVAPVEDTPSVPDEPQSSSSDTGGFADFNTDSSPSYEPDSFDSGSVDTSSSDF